MPNNKTTNLFDGFTETEVSNNSIYSFDDNRDEILVDENGKRFRYNNLDLTKVPFYGEDFVPAEGANLQIKEVTPTKSQQTITSDKGYYGLEQVIVQPIPDNFSEVGNVTATADDVAAGKVFVDNEGKEVIGTLATQAAQDTTLDVNNTSHEIQPGIYIQTQTVDIELQTKSVNPGFVSTEVSPDSGKVLSKVTVNPIGIKKVLNSAGGYTVTVGV